MEYFLNLSAFPTFEVWTWGGSVSELGCFDIPSTEFKPSFYKWQSEELGVSAVAGFRVSYF